MLHASAPLSTAARAAARARRGAPRRPRHGRPGDVLLDRLELGQQRGDHRARRRWRETRGVRTIAITSLRHATSDEARASGGPRLHELVDVAIDNGGRGGRRRGRRSPGVPTRVGPDLDRGGCRDPERARRGGGGAARRQRGRRATAGVRQQQRRRAATRSTTPVRARGVDR